MIKHTIIGTMHDGGEGRVLSLWKDADGVYRWNGFDAVKNADMDEDDAYAVLVEIYQVVALYYYGRIKEEK